MKLSFMRAYFLIIIPIFLITMCSQNASWRGEHRDGHFQEEGLLKHWPENGPKLVLLVEGIGLGHSSAIVANHTIYVTGKLDTLDYLSAIDNAGRLKWQVPYGASWGGSFPETYSTPTAKGNRIFVFSGSGELVCLDWDTGEVQYEETWHNKGAIIYSDGMLYCYEEKRGNLGLVKPNPKNIDLISYFKFEGSGGHWSHPSIFNGNLFIHHRDVLMVYDI